MSPSNLTKLENPHCKCKLGGFASYGLHSTGARAGNFKLLECRDSRGRGKEREPVVMRKNRVAENKLKRDCISKLGVEEKSLGW